MTAGRVFLLTALTMAAVLLIPNLFGLAVGMVLTAVMVVGAVVSIGRDRARRQAEADAIRRRIEHIQELLSRTEGGGR